MSPTLPLADNTVHRYRRKGVAVDTELLVLLAVGRYERSYISRFKRTAQYTGEDYDILSSFVGRFEKVILSPHVLCEVSNHSFQIPQGRLELYLGYLLDLVSRLEEIYVPKDLIIENACVKSVGVTDTGLIICCLKGPYLLLTRDRALTGMARREGVDVFHFDEIRGYAWF